MASAADSTGPDGDEPRVGVAIATRERRRELEGALARLLALPERPPVVVADNGSRDDTAARIRARFPAVAVLELGENRGAGARNAAVEALATPYVAFSDDDSWWAAGALERAADTLDRVPRLGVLAARVLVGSDHRLDPVCRSMRSSPLGEVPDVGPRVLGFVACGAVVRRSAYLQVGGFHPRYGVGGEEALLALDLTEQGWDCAYVDSVVAHHHPSPVRNRSARRIREIRNDMWTLWLRRPLTGVLPRTARVVARLPVDREARSGMWQALAGARWVLRERVVIAPSTERSLRRLGAAGKAWRHTK
jgi:N-acetylglucosaminyl-diphospho-decaprenol L-rhamnosyltransferase